MEIATVNEGVGRKVVSGVTLVSVEDLRAMAEEGGSAVIFVCDTKQQLRMPPSVVMGIDIFDVFCGNFLPSDDEEFVSSLGSCRVSNQLAAEVQNFIHVNSEIERMNSRIYETRDRVLGTLFSLADFFVPKPPYGRRRIILLGEFSGMKRPEAIIAAAEKIMMNIASFATVRCVELEED
jgi:hypothetical protein